MPEAPDLQAILEFLSPRIVGRTIVEGREVKPLVLRSFAETPFADDIRGHSIADMSRRGKLLFVALSGSRLILVNPMLTGGLVYCPSKDRVAAATNVMFTLDNEMDLRYFDPKRMGKVYYLTSRAQEEQIPDLEERGPDVLDEPMDLETFRERLRRFRGEIKGVLTRGGLVAGIGNAYADEILFEARLFPFKKRTRLTPEEVIRLHEATYSVPQAGLRQIRALIGDRIQKKQRGFLKVHGKRGQPCPRCGHPISAVTANQRETDFCRRCQPGLLVRN